MGQKKARRKGPKSVPTRLNCLPVLPQLEAVLGRDEDVGVAVVVEVDEGVGVRVAELPVARRVAQRGERGRLLAVTEK